VPAAERAALCPCQRAPFDFARYLPLLAFFAPFSGTDRRWMAEHLAVFDLPRGTVLHAPGDAPGDAYIVLRGVAVASCARGDRHEPLRVIGPGHLTGAVPRIDGAPHDTTCLLREDSVVMRLDAEVFDAWFHGSDRRALDFLHVLTLELVADLSCSTQALARHVNAARVRHGGQQV
ncbi:MAG: cyclic nucleotide-binding domain-containing protein, partial [Myxococcales bacterium]|nr:cyclic nucleotide-binding domain-containing protein [Myxococcales bacterium]